MKGSPVFIASAGTISAIGGDVASSLAALEKGEAGMGEITMLETIHKGKIPVAEVRYSNDELAAICGLSPKLPRTALLAAVAAGEALNSSGLRSLKGLKIGFISANTVAAQIALLNQCHNYNNTFVHRGFSFESALMDASMLLTEHNDHEILVGGVDEITDYSFNILSRFGLYKTDVTAGIFDTENRGTIAGEGAAFFVLGAQPSSSDKAVLEGFVTCYKPSSESEIETLIADFLAGHCLTNEDIDLVITGKNGDHQNDAWFKNAAKIFNKSICINYKNLCGEYPTATAFALWYAVNIIKSGSLKAAAEELPADKKLKRILIWNHYLGIHHSLFLVTAC